MNHLRNAIAKCYASDLGKTTIWVGYLIPMEILALCEAGARVTTWGQWALDRARRSKEEGISGGVHFYFTATKDLDQKLRESEKSRLSYKYK